MISNEQNLVLKLLREVTITDTITNAVTVTNAVTIMIIYTIIVTMKEFREKKLGLSGAKLKLS